MSTGQENTYNVLIPVSLVLVWGDNNELAKKDVTGVRPPEKGCVPQSEAALVRKAIEGI